MKPLLAPGRNEGQISMGILDTLRISTVNRSTAPGGDPVQRARAKLIAGIQEQKRSVDAELRNERYKTTRKKAGEIVDKRFRPWYFRVDKTFYTNLRYGTTTVEFPGGNSIEAGRDLSDVLKLYDKLVDAIEAGEMDEELKELSARRGRRGGKAEPTQRAATAARRR